MSKLVSLQALLDTAIQAIIHTLALEAGVESALPHPQTLKLSRQAPEISYIYRLDPKYANLLQTWPESFLKAWSSERDHPSTAQPPDRWLRYLLPHQTCCASLPSGQLLFYPQAAVLGGWLWVLTASQQEDPPQPQRITTPAHPPAFPSFRAPVAERLQLSPLALLHYTHQRCQQLASSSHPSSDDPFLSAPETWPDLAPTTPAGQRVLRALVRLVDHLGNEDFPLRDSATALNSQAISQGFVNGYHLCEAVYLWLKEIRIPVTSATTTTLLRGVELSLDKLLWDWLQAPNAP